MKKKILLAKGADILRAAMILCWLYLLRYSQARTPPYFVLAGAALVLTVIPLEPLSGRQNTWSKIGASVFAFAVALANYKVYTHFYQGAVCFLCGFAVADILFRWLVPLSGRGWKPRSYSWEPCILWLAATVLYFAVDFLILYDCYYPGIATPDSVRQIQQMMTGAYDNFHPYYHTQLVRIFYIFGLNLFGNANQAMFLFLVIQVLTMASVFAYVVVTLYQKKVPLPWILFCGLWFLCLPAHVMYSFTLWKDVLWSGMAALFLTALFRIFFGVGKWSWLNHLLLALGAFGFCLLRNNGLLAFAPFAILFLVFFLRRFPRAAAIVAAAVCSSWILLGPALDFQNIAPTPILEPAAVPIQQIGLTVQEGNPLLPEEVQLLEQIMDVDKIGELYSPIIVDPLKNEIRFHGDEAFVAENPSSFVKLWIGIGLRHPWTYLRAWIDQTVGYWNSGYDYWVWESGIYTNDLGLAQHIRRPGLFHLWQLYLQAFENTGLSLFLSIGFHVWLAAGAFVLSAANKRWRAACLAVVPLSVILTLLLGAPVFSEFRYAYPVFTTLPIVLASAFCRDPSAGQE